MSNPAQKSDIEFYFDFASPYGYLAAQKIDQIGERYGRRVNWHPIMLGAIFKQTGNMPNADIGLKGDYMRMDVPRLAKMMGAPITGFWITMRPRPCPSPRPVITTTSEKAPTSRTCRKSS